MPPVTPQPLLENTPSDIIASLMTQPSGSQFSDPVVKLAWPVYISELPDGQGVPNEAAAIYDTHGRILARFLASGNVVQDYGIQVKIRATNYRDGYIRLGQLAKFFSTVKHQTVTIASVSYVVDTIMQTSPVISIGQDERRRAMLTVNFMLSLIE